ncbi:MAG: hypothetical protein ACR2MG_13655 [Pyrinomonadaceae bacterium]
MASALIQIPEISIAHQIRPEKIPGGGFIWGVCFKLPIPAEEDGHIIQHIVQEENGTQNNKTIYRRIGYWEAWEVKKGETQPRQTQSVRAFIEEQKGTAPPHGDYNIPMNDIFYKKYTLGAKGNYIIWGLAGFYHKPLTPDFIVAHPRTGAGGLKSTTIKPAFWTLCGLVRQVSFNYNCETESEAKDDSKQILNPTKTKIEMSFADNWFN